MIVPTEIQVGSKRQGRDCLLPLFMVGVGAPKGAFLMRKIEVDNTIYCSLENIPLPQNEVVSYYR
jgi:hypothetical protein